MALRKKDIPNYLTYFRIAIIPVFVVVFLMPETLGVWSYYTCGFLFFLAGLTDWLDGYVARIWQAQSNIGRFLDPIADKLLVATCLLLLVYTGRADVLPAIAIVCREILVSGLREYLAEIRVSVPVSKLAKIKTAAQMLAIFILLLAVGYEWWVYLGRLLLWISAILTLITGYVYLKVGMKHLVD